MKNAILKLLEIGERYGMERFYNFEVNGSFTTLQGNYTADLNARLEHDGIERYVYWQNGKDTAYIYSFGKLGDDRICQIILVKHR